MTKVFDCFTFFNEVDLLEVRLQELFNVVDTFIIVESSRTFSGLAKPSVFRRYEDKFRWARGKIIYQFIESSQPGQHTHRHNRAAQEVSQRNQIMDGLDLSEVEDNDLVLISDLDEIPKASTTSLLKSTLTGSTLYVFKMKMLKYFLNNVSRVGGNGDTWLGTVGCTYKTLKAILPQGARIGDPMAQRSGCLLSNLGRSVTHYERHVEDAGWHLSYMGGFSSLKMKANNMVDRHTIDLDLKQPEVDDVVPQSLHNFADFRSVNDVSINQAMQRFGIEIQPLTPDQKNVDLDLPAPARVSPARYERLFYFSSPL